MAQRVYLLPVRKSTLDLFLDLLLAPAEREPECWRALLAAAAPHRQVNNVSRALARALDERACDEQAELEAYHRATNLRPYLITAPPLSAAVGLVDDLLGCRDAVSVEALLKRQLEPLAYAYRAHERTAVSDVGDWQELAGELAEVKRMRAAGLAGDSYCSTAGTPTTLEVDGQHLVVNHESDRRESLLTADEVPAVYGNSLGSLYGRLVGLSEPSWWMGRDYWFGPLLLAELPPREQRRFTAFRQACLRFVTVPTKLFDRVAVPGCADGFSPLCPGYSTGLYFPPDRLGDFIKLLAKEHDTWTALGQAATGYDKDSLRQVEQSVAEALVWASRHGLGLLEGDELVGTLGRR